MAKPINYLEIAHFKAFSDSIKIPLNGRNLLMFGENGSGKSSVCEALRLLFFYDSIKSEHATGATPEEQEAKWKTYLAEHYQNRMEQEEHSIEINVNGQDYLEFSRQADSKDYHAYFISNHDLYVGNYISYREILERVWFHGNKAGLLGNDVIGLESQIAETVNSDLKKYFKEEGITISISREDDFNCRLSGKWGGEPTASNIRTYFNEAKINLVVILLLLISIRLLADKGERVVRILILDDLITSLDASNRMLMMRYILKEFPDFTKMIFTHNVSYFNLWLYTANSSKAENGRWLAMNVYEVGDRHRAYEYKKLSQKDKTECDKLKERLEADGEDLGSLGNDIRKHFEYLLHEFAKILHVGGVEECSNILDRLESNKTIYLHVDQGKLKTADDMLDYIHGCMGLEMNDVLKREMRKKYADYRANKFLRSILPVISELRMYQKLSMHPLSHSRSTGIPSYTIKELTVTIALLKKFEDAVNSLINFDVSTL